MFGNDRRMSQELDNYITGHYGEDQFKTRRKTGGSKRHIHQRVDITTISTDKLEKDLCESENDILVCQVALDNEIYNYSGGLVVERLKSNMHFVDVITKELFRRRAEIKEAGQNGLTTAPCCEGEAPHAGGTGTSA